MIRSNASAMATGPAARDSRTQRDPATGSKSPPGVTATPVDTMVWSLVAGDGQTVSTTGWGSGSGGGYDIAISLTNEPWSP